MGFAYIKTDCGVTDRKLSAFFLHISNGQPLDCGLDDFGWGWKHMNLTRFVSLVGLLGMMTSSCIPGGRGENEEGADLAHALGQSLKTNALWHCRNRANHAPATKQKKGPHIGPFLFGLARPILTCKEAVSATGAPTRSVGQQEPPS